MKRVLRRVLLTVVILVLYLLFFPARTGTEFMLDALWALRPEVRIVPATAESVDGESTSIPYRIGDVFGYLDRSGTVLYQGIASERVALASDRFVLFGENSGSVVVQSPTGAFLHSINQSGYPYLFPDGLIMVDSDGLSVSGYDSEGRRLWHHSFDSTVTAIAGSEDLTVIGLAGGGVRAVDRSGTLLDVDAAAVGLSGVTQAVSVRPDGGAFAVVSGAEIVVTSEQARSMFVTLYEVQDGGAVPILRREFVRDPFRTPDLTVGASGEKLVFSEREEGSGSIRVIDLQSGDEYAIAATHPPASVTLDNTESFLWVLEQAERPDPSRGFRYPARVTYASAAGRPVIHAEFAADTLSMRHYGEVATITVDDRLLGLRVERR